MHLSKLVMRNFKKYRRAEVEFQDGLTGIVGSNGSGKSTIVEAIAWALYGNKASTIKRDYIRSARAKDSDNVEVMLHLDMGKQELAIYRSMKGKSLTPEAYLLLDGRRIAGGTKEVDQRLEEILKIGYQDFMKTFYARQKDLDNLLKEGGTGKREYLLKLLGLDGIKERAIEQIKSDRASMDEQKNRMAGAIAEIGDVDGRLQEAAKSISLAQADMDAAAKKEAELCSIKEKRKMELDIQAEKRRSHDLLVERASRLELAGREKKEIIAAEEKRLKDIELSKRLLQELAPGLSRLESVKARLEALEPKRGEHGEISRRIAGRKAEIEGARKMLQENALRLTQMQKEKALLDEIRPAEDDYGRTQAALADLERLRDLHGSLQTRLKEGTARLAGTDSSLGLMKSAVCDLLKARARLEEILPCKDDYERLQSEKADLILQREKQKELDGLYSRRNLVEGRRVRLEEDANAARKELESLKGLGDQEKNLRKQDEDLDGLITHLNSVLSDLLGSLKVWELAKSEATKNLLKVKALGEEGICPTCERPLEGQRDFLVKKYDLEASEADKSIADLSARIKGQRDKIDGATRARSSLKKAFDELNAGKSRRSELLAGLKSLEVQIAEAEAEQNEIARQVLDLGGVEFNPKRLDEVDAECKRLAPLAEEHRNLSIRLEDLPQKEMEMAAFEKERGLRAEGCKALEKEILALGYDESKYAGARKRLAELLPLHNQFISFSRRAGEIPEQEGKVAHQRSAVQRLQEALKELQEQLEALEFDPQEYEELLLERKSLAGAEEEANRIRIRLAAEPEIIKRLHEAAFALESLEKDLAGAKRELMALGYSRVAHEAAAKALTESEKDLEGMRKEVSRKSENLAILNSDLSRLKGDARRKRDYEKALSEVNRRLEVIDTTRGLTNGFMDQVLIRVKNDIARTAGEILEEVSGKYSLLKIDDDFNILVEDGSEFYPISRYSGGEIDMIAVSVRVAISEYLMRFGPDGESYSFLILDEVFGSQDIEHREKMIQMLRSLEERFPQVIAISHISDVQGQFDNTMLVVEDEMGNSRVEMA